MTEYALLFDKDLCFGCQACEVACKQENHLNPGPRRLQVIEVDPSENSRNRKLTYKLIRCLHCLQPACQSACPTGAVEKRPDGVVLIHSGLCTGCKACLEACPFEAIQIHEETKTMEKCTLCSHRLDKGLTPACVASCPTGAIRFGNLNQLIESRRKNRLTYLGRSL